MLEIWGRDFEKKQLLLSLVKKREKIEISGSFLDIRIKIECTKSFLAFHVYQEVIEL